MFYVYILKSLSVPTETYVGFTENLKQRILDHNAKKSFHTKKWTPWKVENYFAFTDKKKALSFEKYLKSSSGRAFRRKRF